MIHKIDGKVLRPERHAAYLLRTAVSELTDTGDCFHIHFSVACFPKSREIALKIVKEIFK